MNPLSVVNALLFRFNPIPPTELVNAYGTRIFYKICGDIVITKANQKQKL